MERIGIIEPNIQNIKENLKSQLVFFDKLLLDYNALEENYKLWESLCGSSNNELIQIKNRVFTDIEYLFKKNQLSDLDSKMDSFGVKNIPFENDDIFLKMHNQTSKEINKLLSSNLSETQIALTVKFRSFASKTRLARLYLSKFDKENSYSSLLISNLNSISNTSDSDEQITSLILKKIPIPKDNVSLEKILEFINKEDIKRDRRRLQVWLNKHRNSNTNIKQLNQEIESLLLDYENRMRISLKEYELTKFELIIKLPLEIIEKTLKIKWSELPDTYFKYKKAKYKLLKEETKAPGKELAFISKIKNELK